MPAFAAAGQTISFSDINTRLGRPAESTISLDDSELRITANVATASTTISIYDHVAGTSRSNFVISSNTLGYDLKAHCDTDGYSAGKAYVTLTINSNVYVGGNGGATGTYSTANWALNVAGFTAGDKITITNNGYILGQGGAGGGSGAPPGNNGGNAIRIGSTGVTLINNGTIKGGGGGAPGGLNSTVSLGSKFNRYTGYGVGGNGGGGAGYPAGAGVASSTVTTDSRGGTMTLGASNAGTTFLGGQGGAAVGYGTPGNGANGGDLGAAGGNTYTYVGNPYYGLTGYSSAQPGWGGNPGWAIYYDSPTVRDATVYTNTATVGAIGYGGIYG